MGITKTEAKEISKTRTWLKKYWYVVAVIVLCVGVAASPFKCGPFEKGAIPSPWSK